jgi:hypothetical protein
LFCSIVSSSPSRFVEALVMPHVPPLHVYPRSAWALLKLLHHRQQDRFTAFVAEHYPDVELYAPVFKRVTRPHGCRRPLAVIATVFPGYLFVHSDLGAGYARYLTATPIRAHWVRFGTSIETIPDKVIAALRTLEARNELVREAILPRPLRPGARVRVQLPVGSIDAVVLRLVNAHKVTVDSRLGRVTAPICVVEPS